MGAIVARYTLPGIVAHRSALSGGARLPIPDFGDPPVQFNLKVKTKGPK
jgi:hypothetical protein